MLNINDLRRLYLGVQGENEDQSIIIDVKPWMVQYPNGSFSIWHKRNGDSVPYATGAEFDSDRGVVVWTPTSVDTYVAGEGTAEIRLVEDNIIKKTKTIITGVSPGVTGAVEEMGSGWQGYIDEVDRIKGDAVDAKNAAKEYAWDAEAYAKGTRNGSAVSHDDPTYDNNAKYYAEKAQEAAESISTETAAAQTAATAAQNSASAAAGSASAAAGSATQAANSATSAANSKTSAQNSASAAAGSATAAENAKTAAAGSASAAAGSATSAGNSASAAAGSASTAANAAQAAGGHAATASEAATNATGAATAAGNSASAAAGSATAAGNAKTAAEGSATAAANSASSAAGSAASASNSASAASGSATSAGNSATAAAGSATAAESSKTAAAGSATAAAGSATAAAGLATAADASAVAARNSEIGASQSETIARNSATEATAAAEAAASSEEAARASQNAAMAAQAAAEAAAAEEVAEWLAAHVDPESQFVIDDTLLIQGAAADAKKTGEKVTELKGDFNYENGRLANVDGIQEIPFGLGLIDITIHGWTWYAADQWICTPSNYTLHLKPGDRIVADAGVAYSVGWKKSDDTYGRVMDATGETIVGAEGDYVFVANYYPRQQITDVTELKRKVRIYAYSETLAKKIDDQKGNEARIETIEEAAFSEDWEQISLTPEYGYYSKGNGNFNEDAERRCATLTDIAEGEIYKITTYSGTSNIAGIIFKNSGGTVVSYDLVGTGTAQTITDYEFTVPAGCATLIVQSSTTTMPTLYKKVKVFAAYTKAESDARFATRITEGETVAYVEEITVHLGYNLLAGVYSSEGWTVDGNTYTHNSGNRDVLTFNTVVETGEIYLLEFDSVTTDETVRVALGDTTYRMNIYTDTEHKEVPLKAYGNGKLYFEPISSGYTGSISNITLKKIQSTGDEKTLVVYCTLTDNHAENYGFYNTLLGKSTLEGAPGSTRTVAIGMNALRDLQAGHRNIGIGTFAMSQMIGGEANVAIGADAMLAVQQAEGCVAIGKSALYNGVHNENCVAIGLFAGALAAGESLTGCTFLGAYAGHYNKKNYNTYIGNTAGYRNRTGRRNTIVGSDAMGQQTGDDNTCIGASTGYPEGGNYCIALGKGAVATKSGQMMLGSSNVSEVVFCGNKKINFNNDGTVTWEELT